MGVKFTEKDQNNIKKLIKKCGDKTDSGVCSLFSRPCKDITLQGECPITREYIKVYKGFIPL